eukprot:COSAG01_NODE_150_length_23941_cov_44.277200_13_plen_133_part_00
MGQTAAAATVAVAVSHFLVWIGSPCLRRCVYGASIGGGVRRTQPGVRAERLALAPKGAGRGKGKGRVVASRGQLGDGSMGALPIETRIRVRVEIMGAPTCRNVGESQPVRMMIDLMIFSRSRVRRYVVTQRL